MDSMMEYRALDDSAVRQLFGDYVSRMEDKERHTQAACKEADLYYAFLTGAFSANTRIQNELYERMLGCAVEFEESGFIAGFKTAMALLKGQEEFVSPPPQIPTQHTEQSQHEAANKPQKASRLGEDFVTSLQIADMFETRNTKVINRIERYILPKLDTESKAYFEKVCGVNIQNKPVTYYKLNRAACLLYLEQMEPKKKTFVNIAGGYAKLTELMEKVFPADVRMVMA